MYLKLFKNVTYPVVSELDKFSTVKKTNMKSSKADFITWTFRLPPKRQLSILLNFFFPFIDIRCFFSSLNLCYLCSVLLVTSYIMHDESGIRIIIPKKKDCSPQFVFSWTYSPHLGYLTRQLQKQLKGKIANRDSEKVISLIFSKIA